MRRGEGRGEGVGKGTELEWKIKLKMPFTLVSESVGNDTPIKNPKTDPTNNATTILIDSFGFLIITLQEKI